MLPPSELSKSQIDRLGDRLRKGDVSEDDLRLLDSYRRSFSEVYEEVVGRIREQVGLEPTGRGAKSNKSIIEKRGGDPELASHLKTLSDISINIEMALNRKDIISMVEEWQRWSELNRRTSELIKRLRSRNDFSN
jgi:hypothetical protein